MYDLWLVRLDQNGNLLWQKGIGGNQEDSGGDVLLMPDGRFLISGINNSSNSGDITMTSNGGLDYWLIQLEPEELSLHENPLFGVSVYPNPATDAVNIRFTETQERITATIHDVAGRKISEITNENSFGFRIALPQTEGLYFLTLTNQDNHSKTLKIFKKP